MTRKPVTIAIIQARMGSTRLPGKVLQDLAGKPMLARVVERTRLARTLDGVVVATTTEEKDEPIVRTCQERGYPVQRGNLQDVLDRYYQAAKQEKAEIVVRITADCPVIDPGLIDETTRLVQASFETPQNRIDLAATRLPPPWKRTYPIGLDVEVCTFAALERAWKEADQAFHREHVLPFIYEGVEPRPISERLSLGVSGRGFRIAVLNNEQDYGSLRWTVDTAEDLELLRQVYLRFGDRMDFSWREVLALFEREPQLATINASIVHKNLFEIDERTGQTPAKGGTK